MPFRTRDFTVFLGSVGFLLSAILFTAAEGGRLPTASSALVITGVPSTESTYSATVKELEVFDRAARLTELAQKIETQTLPTVAVAPIVPESVATTTTQATAGANEIVHCPSYTTTVPTWSAEGLEFAVVEGARIVYRLLPDAVFASTTPPTREVVLQLPLSSQKSATGSCLSGTIVGIALDGSLIGNDEYGLYGVFGEGTLIGYALDGFPIYGKSSRPTDSCGGTVVGDEYRYFLSPERQGVIGCYSGAPMSL